MKSLHKSLDVLEHVFNAEGRAVTPTAAAKACGINIATTSRILSSLAGRGYLKKVSRNTGYVPGPVVFALSDRRSFYGRAAHAASDVLKDLAARLDAQINISVLEGIHRYILYHYSASEKFPIIPRTAHIKDHYSSGTGRVLLAHADAETLDEIVERLGLPGDKWPDVADRDDLDRQLTQIRTSGMVSFPHHSANGKDLPLNVYGVAVKVEGLPVCALGTAVNANRPDQKILDELSNAARRIEENIRLQMRSF